jgi:type IV fimbrial biogenesis protein FimT
VNKSNCPRAAQKGFTLVEVMVAIAIFAILAGIAVPSLRSFLVRSAFQSVALDLRGAASRARAEAIARGTFVTLAPTTAGDWTSGYQIFVDPLQKGVFSATDKVGDGTEVFKAELLSVGTIPQNSSFSWPATTSSGVGGSAPYFLFDSQGQPRTSTGAIGNASLPLCIPSDTAPTNNCREVVVDRVGRVRVDAFTKAI